MFNRLKSFSEDVAKSINDIQQGDPVRRNAESIRQLKNGSALLNTTTPESSDLLQPRDEESTEPEGQSGNDTQDQTAVSPLAGIDMDALPDKVKAKLRKFVKYEEKYPVLLDAYKTEKRKAELVAAFEKVLRECTPVSSIADAGVLVEFLKSINDKTALVEQELKRTTAENRELAKRTADAEKTVRYAEEKLTKALETSEQNVVPKEGALEGDLEELVSIREKLVTLEGEKRTLQQQSDASVQRINDLTVEMEQLRQKIALVEAERDNLRVKVEELENVANGDSQEDVQKVDTSSSKKNQRKKKNKGKNVPLGNWQAQYDEASARCNSLLQEKSALEAELQKTNKSLQAKDEEIENLRDSLKLIGDDLVVAKEELKNRQPDAKAESEAKEEAEKLARELDEYKKTIEALSGEKQKLNERVGELSKFKSTDSSLKLEIASLQASLSHKDEQIKDLRAEIDRKSKERDELNGLVSQLRGVNSELSNSNKALVSEKSALINKQEVAFERSNSLNAELSKLQASRQAVVGELEALKVKYETLTRTRASSSDEVQILKQQCDELSMKTKEAQTRIDNLEDELSETKNILQERTRESSSIKRLLLDAEEQVQAKSAELKAELRALTEEKDEAEAQLRGLLKKKQRELDQMSEETQKHLATISDLEAKCRDLESHHKLMVEQADQNGASGGNQQYKDLKATIEELRGSLQGSIKKVKDLENVNRVLKKLNEENSLKLERLSKNYKHVTQQYRQMQSVAAKPTESTRTSEDTDSTQDPHNERDTNTAYLKNVLVGFLEHKDQRDQLMPVVKTLFHFDDEDERKLLTALK